MSLKSLKVIWILASNTYREIIRDRVLYGILVFAVLLIGLSMALGQLTFAEQSRITIDFGFTAIHISAVILAIFVGSTLLGKEIERKTIVTLLARPVSRTEFIIGKSLGLIQIILVSMAILSVVISSVLIFLQLPMQISFIAGIYGVLLEASLLLTLTLFFGSFASPMLSAAFSIGVFLIGHWLDSLNYFAKKSDSILFATFAKVISFITPNLERFNWRTLFVYHDPVPYKEVGSVTIYALAWCIFLISLTTFILRKRDLG